MPEPPNQPIDDTPLGENAEDDLDRLLAAAADLANEISQEIGEAEGRAGLNESDAAFLASPSVPAVSLEQQLARLESLAGATQAELGTSAAGASKSGGAAGTRGGGQGDSSGGRAGTGGQGRAAAADRLSEPESVNLNEPPTAFSTGRRPAGPPPSAELDDDTGSQPDIVVRGVRRAPIDDDLHVHRVRDDGAFAEDDLDAALDELAEQRPAPDLLSDMLDDLQSPSADAPVEPDGSTAVGGSPDLEFDDDLTGAPAPPDADDDLTATPGDAPVVDAFGAPPPRGGMRSMKSKPPPQALSEPAEGRGHDGADSPDRGDEDGRANPGRGGLGARLAAACLARLRRIPGVPLMIRLSLPLAALGVQLLEAADKPARRLDVRLKTLLGWAGIATSIMAAMTLIWSLLR